MIKSFKDLEIYKEGYDLAKRRFPKEFKKYLDSSVGSCNEMEVHISMAKDLVYWRKEFCENLLKRYEFLGGKIVSLRNNWRTF